MPFLKGNVWMVADALQPIRKTVDPEGMRGACVLAPEFSDKAACISLVCMVASTKREECGKCIGTGFSRYLMENFVRSWRQLWLAAIIRLTWMRRKPVERIRFFLGSSIVDLECERFNLNSFITKLRNKLKSIEGYLCEETPNVMCDGGSQMQHDNYIRDKADAAIFMFFKKAGKYTLKELEIAREAFLKKGKPQVYVFFKTEDKAPDESEDIQRVVRLVKEEYGFDYQVYKHPGTIKLQILKIIAEKMPGVPEIKVKDGTVYIGGDIVERNSIPNISVVL